MAAEILFGPRRSRGSEWFEAAICLLETPIFQRENTKLLEFGFFKCFFCNVTGKKVKQITFFNFFVTLARQLRKQQQLRKLKYEQLRKQPVFLTCEENLSMNS